MKVIVRYHLSARDDLSIWQNSLKAKPDDQLLFAGVLIDEITHALETTQGAPTGCLVQQNRDPQLYFWPFQPNVWVRFVVRDQKHWLFEMERKIMVLGLLQPPPDDAVAL